jgi:hypothetical protein
MASCNDGGRQYLGVVKGLWQTKLFGKIGPFGFRERGELSSGLFERNVGYISKMGQYRSEFVALLKPINQSVI